MNRRCSSVTAVPERAGVAKINGLLGAWTANSVLLITSSAMLYHSMLIPPLTYLFGLSSFPYISPLTALLIVYL